ncbi:hypothetical protein DV515_00000220, partial [Chloebia gouldiae]
MALPVTIISRPVGTARSDLFPNQRSTGFGRKLNNAHQLKPEFQSKRKARTTTITSITANNATKKRWDNLTAKAALSTHSSSEAFNLRSLLNTWHTGAAIQGSSSMFPPEDTSSMSVLSQVHLSGHTSQFGSWLQEREAYPKHVIHKYIEREMSQSGRENWAFQSVRTLAIQDYNKVYYSIRKESQSESWHTAVLQLFTKAMWKQETCKGLVPPKHSPPHTHGVLGFAPGSRDHIPIAKAQSSARRVLVAQPEQQTWFNSLDQLTSKSHKYHQRRKREDEEETGGQLQSQMAAASVNIFLGQNVSLQFGASGFISYCPSRHSYALPPQSLKHFTRTAVAFLQSDTQLDHVEPTDLPNLVHEMIPQAVVLAHLNKFIYPLKQTKQGSIITGETIAAFSSTPLAALLSLRAAHSFLAGERLRLWTVYIALISAALTGCLTRSCHTTLIKPPTNTAPPTGEEHSTRRAEERLQNHSHFVFT